MWGKKKRKRKLSICVSFFCASISHKFLIKTMQRLVLHATSTISFPDFKKELHLPAKALLEKKSGSGSSRKLVRHTSHIQRGEGWKGSSPHIDTSEYIFLIIPELILTNVPVPAAICLHSKNKSFFGFIICTFPVVCLPTLVFRVDTVWLHFVVWKGQCGYKVYYLPSV